MNLALVFGGRSVEHDISIVTAKQIYGMMSGKHKFYLVFASKDDQLFLYTNEQFNLSDFKGQNKYLVPILLERGQILYKAKLGKQIRQNLDAAIFCCHGGYGENGVLASKFLASGVPVSCGSPVALGVCMDKWLTKLFLNAIGVNNTPAFCVDSSYTVDNVDGIINKQFGYPVILKPRCGGSSIGIEVVYNKSQLKHGLQVALEYDSSVIIEKALTNFTEYNCAVLGDSKNIIVSQIDKPEKKEEILSFADKYMSGGKGGKKGSMKTQNRQFPAVLPQKLKDKIQNISKQVFTTLGLHGVVRIDYMVQGNKLYLNEINAIPGSLGYYFFVDNTFTAENFVERLAEIAVTEYNNLQKVNKNYITQLL